MPQYVEAPDGLVEFPDDVTPGQMTVALRDKYSGGPAGKPLFPGQPAGFEPKTTGPSPLTAAADFYTRPVTPAPPPEYGPPVLEGAPSIPSPGMGVSQPSVALPQQDTVSGSVLAAERALPPGITQGPIGMGVGHVGRAMQGITSEQALGIGARFGINPDAVEAGVKKLGSVLEGAVSPRSTAAAVGTAVAPSIGLPLLAGQGIHGLAKEDIPNIVAGALERDPAMAAEGIAGGVGNLPLAGIAHPLARAVAGRIGEAGIPVRTGRLEATATAERLRQDLGLPPSATDAEVSTARGAALRAVHPDTAPDLPPDVAAQALERIQATKRTPPPQEHPFIAEVADAVTRRLTAQGFAPEASTLPVREPIVPTIEGVRATRAAAEGVPSNRRLPAPPWQEGMEGFSREPVAPTPIPRAALPPEQYGAAYDLLVSLVRRGSEVAPTDIVRRFGVPSEVASKWLHDAKIEAQVPEGSDSITEPTPPTSFPKKFEKRLDGLAQRIASGENVTIRQIRDDWGLGNAAAENYLTLARQRAATDRRFAPEAQPGPPIQLPPPRPLTPPAPPPEAPSPVVPPPGPVESHVPLYPGEPAPTVRTPAERFADWKEGSLAGQVPTPPAFVESPPTDPAARRDWIAKVMFSASRGDIDASTPGLDPAAVEVIQHQEAMNAGAGPAPGEHPVGLRSVEAIPPSVPPLAAEPVWKAVGRKAREKKVPAPVEVVAKEPEFAPAPKPEPIAFKADLGSPSLAKTERGTEVETRFAVVPASDLIASHDTGFNVNPSYPAELQPRDRGRAASELQVARILGNLEPRFLGESPKASEGAPIVGPDGVVESGNGRVIALQTGYQNSHDSMPKYVDWLNDNAARFGIDKATVERTDAPVLVRVRQTAVDRADFARQANEAGVARMSPTEQAKSDAGRLAGTLMDAFAPNEDGDLLAASNRPFMQRFVSEIIGPNEAPQFMDSDGNVNKALIDRVKNAILYRAYDDASVTELLAESTDNNIRNIGNALLRAAPDVAGMRQGIESGHLHPLDIAKNVAEASRLLSSLKREGNSVDAYLRQDLLFGEPVSPLTADLLRYFDSNNRSPKRISELLRAYALLVAQAGDPSEGSLFGDLKAPTPEEVLHAAKDLASEAFGEDTRTGSLFADASSESAPRTDAGTRKGSRRQTPDVPAGRESKDAGRVEADRGGGRGGSAPVKKPFNEAYRNPFHEPSPDQVNKPSHRRVPLDELEANELTKGMRDLYGQAKQALSPAAVHETARLMADNLREKGAVSQAKVDKVTHQLAPARVHFDRTVFPTDREILDAAGDAEKVDALIKKFPALDFEDRYINGETQPTPELEKYAEQLRAVAAAERDAIRDVNPAALQDFIQNYIPQNYKNVTRAEDYAATFVKQRSLVGDTAWKKQRIHQGPREYLEAGLIPKYPNPVDRMLNHSEQVGKFVAGQKAIKEGRVSGYIKATYADDNGVLSPTPAGWERLDPRIGTLRSPSKVRIEETYDEKLMNELNALAKDLGVRHLRLFGRGGPIGFSVTGGAKVVTKFASGTSTLTHEIGHQADDIFHLWDRIVLNAPDKLRPRIKEQLRHLADLREEGNLENVSPGRHSYLRKKPEQMANLIDGWVNHRDRMAREMPDLYRRAMNTIQSIEELHPLLTMRPTLTRGQSTTDVKVRGQITHGYLMAPKSVTRILNRYLSPGISHAPAYRLLHFGFNALNQFQLSLSPFHLLFTSIDASVSQLATALSAGERGALGEAGKALVRTPFAPVLNVLEGRKLVNAVLGQANLSPEDTEALRGVMLGGGRFKQDRFYATGARKGFVRAVRQAVAELGEGRLGQAGKQAFGAAWRSPFAFLETVSAPMMEYIIPRQKLGVAAQMATEEVARQEERLERPLMFEERRRVWARAVDAVDDRLGQFIYDNTFWNRTAKEGLFLAVRSLGWTAGSLRAGLGAVSDAATLKGRIGEQELPEHRGWKPLPEPKGEEPAADEGEAPDEETETTPTPDLRDMPVTLRMNYIAALALMTAAFAATYQKLATGKNPQTWKDLVFPRTGGRTPSGADERMTTPTYAKDYVEWVMHPLKTALSKLNPGPVALSELFSNKTFPNKEIYDPKDPLYKRGLDVVKWLATEKATPIGVQQLERAKKNPESHIPAIAQFSGLRPAPAMVSDSALVTALKEYAREHGQTAPMSREDAARSEKKRDYTAELRAAKTDEDRQVIRDKMRVDQQDGGLRRWGAGVKSTDSAAIEKKASESSLQSLYNRPMPIRQALDLYDLGTPDEEAELKPILKKKAFGSGHGIPSWNYSLSPKAKAEVRSRLDAIFPERHE